MRAKAPRIVRLKRPSPRELLQRHGRVLLVEARSGVDGRVRVLAVLDLVAEALAEEARRHEAPAAGRPAVEVIDRASGISSWRGWWPVAWSRSTEGERRCIRRLISLPPASRGARQGADHAGAGDTGRTVAAHGARARLRRVPDEALPLVGKAIAMTAAAKPCCPRRACGRSVAGNPRADARSGSRAVPAPQARSSSLRLSGSGAADLTGLIEQGLSFPGPTSRAGRRPTSPLTASLPKRQVSCMSRKAEWAILRCARLRLCACEGLPPVARLRGQRRGLRAG